MKLQNLILILILIICFGLLPKAQAVSPAPDGGYPGGNTAEGQAALLSLTTGGFNTAVGFFSLRSDTAGQFNTALGAGTLLANTADYNTATGAGALLSNSTGSQNTANGTLALFSNTTGESNTGGGITALFNNTTGDQNTAFGASALASNTSGGGNTAIGLVALSTNSTGTANTATGTGALGANTGGNNNTAIGSGALFSNMNGSLNVALGGAAGGNLTTGDNNIDIGYNVLGVAGESNTIRIGNTDITTTIIRGISGQTVASGAAVLVASNGHLGTMTSSKRFKDEIKPMDKASDALFSLKPVTFHYKKEIDPAGTQQFGLLAEDVDKVNPDLVVRDENGKVNSVRYEQVNAMLLNEFLKEHRKVAEQDATITQLKSTATKQETAIAQQRKDFEATINELKHEIEIVRARSREQDAKIQNVSDQIKLSRPAPQTVVNNQ